jgi:hypothetical protein
VNSPLSAAFMAFLVQEVVLYPESNYLLTSLYATPDEFGVSPGFHIQDLKYTFNDPTSPAPWPKAQDALQEAIITFVQGGVPRFTDHKAFPHLGSHGTIVNVTSQGAVETIRNLNATRCEWWANLVQ